MSAARHVPVIELELRRAIKAGAPTIADWREMLAWASGGSPKGEYEWARWLDMAAAALVVWVNAWQESINAGKQADGDILAKLASHRDGIRALRSQLYFLSICNAKEYLRELRAAEKPAAVPAPVITSPEPRKPVQAPMGRLL